MGKKLTNAPVYYTVGQIQFNPILELNLSLPSIQSKMREMHFSDYRPEIVNRLVLPFSGQQVGQAPVPPGLSAQTRHMFGTMDGNSIFLLENNSLSLQTTQYESFQKFLDTFMLGLEIINKSINIDFFERIGLRYLDAIQPIKEKNLNDLIIPEVTGLAFKLDGEIKHNATEAIFKNPLGLLTSRVLIRDGKVGLPLELTMSQSPTIASRFTEKEGLHAILDNDASVVNREVFDLVNVRERLTSLHGEINKAFYATVTPDALAVWS